MVKITLLEKLVSLLDKINWNRKSNAHKNVEFLLKDFKQNYSKIQSETNIFSDIFYKSLSEYSVETPTHFKWLLHTGEQSIYKIWIHEYKTEIEKNVGYAVVPHNHRYWFSSFILNGGFTSTFYKVDRLKENTIENYRVINKVQLIKNEIYSLDSEFIHSLSAIENKTFSIIIQSRALKDFSESFNFDTKQIFRHYSFESRIKNLEKDLKSM